ncbi:MAG: PqqD family protein [Pyrinomonadaceae bacterium]|nr:PqqD family protein [Pyrinomonadaceae bacterium]
MSQIELTPETVIRRSETLLSNNLGEDIVMMDIEDGSYYGLENVAAQIWKMTEQPISVGSLCDQLTNEYDVSPEKCKQDVMTFLDDLLKRKIAEVVA